MIPLALDDVRRLCVGSVTVSGTVTEHATVTGIQIDSRRVEPGDLFVAVGRGHEFAAEGLERGAVAVLVPDEPFAALAALATEIRSRTDARVVGITGSTGKTSTKDILAALCGPHARTVAAEGGHNNEVGLPLTIARIEPDTEVVVAEMGMRGLGQIAELCAIARPHVAVVTGIGPVHLELLGTVERVAEAKAEVVAALPPGGTAVVPVRADAPELEPFLGRADVELVRVGEGGDVSLVRFEPPALVADVGGERVELEVPFSARHQARNVLSALAAYRALGLPLAGAAEGAREIRLSRWRGEESELPGGGLLINDAYNANPDSMRAALEHLVERAAGRRTVAILGEMAELGPGAPALHERVGATAAELGVDRLVAVGPLAAGYLRGAGDRIAASWMPLDLDLDELRAALEPGDVVLVKASRAAGLERVAGALAGATV